MKLALAQIDMRLGDIEGICGRIEDQARLAHERGARVGSVEHPMVPEHYIEWIALEAEGRLEVHYLQPGMKPATFFAGGSKTGTVYAYCNLHGLWSATF